MIASIVQCLKGINPKFPTCEKQKIEKTHAKENNHTHKTIFMWFGNLPTSTELQRFHYYQGKIQSVAVQFFHSLEKPTTNPNHQSNVLYILHTRITKVTFSQGHHATLFESGWVVNSIKHDQAPQNPTVSCNFILICIIIEV